jgi:ABC-type sugar transport system ATPase subunit
MSETPLLELHNISKAFGGVQALKDVSLNVEPGEVHAVIGENGAGKSTLMKIIAGALQPDSGEIIFDDTKVELGGPRDASELGITIVYQEPVYFAQLSVVENFYLGEELMTRSGALNWAAMTTGAAVALQRMELPTGILNDTMDELSLGTQQLVLIARGIHKKAQLLILDEPTSILSQAETDTLFRTIKELQSEGVSILYISHRISEIFRIADRISVLRDGELVNQFEREDATEDKLITAMSGRHISATVYRPRPFQDEEPILQVRDLGRLGYYRGVSFDLRPGEVLGLYGLVGAGRSEVARAIFGEMPAEEGTIRLDGQDIELRNDRDAIRRGIVYVPEDRREQGLFPIRAIRDNLSAGLLGKVTGVLSAIKRQAERELAKREADRLDVKASSILAPVSSLSGGNQQKVVLGRGLLHNPRILLLDEPTRGIDVGTKAQIHELIMSLAEQNVAILLVSSDLPEVLALADNFLVMHEGYVTGYLSRSDAHEEEILRLALGLEARVNNHIEMGVRP